MKNGSTTCSCDVLIVGGGIAGASLGCLLATRTDLKTVVLEASPILGGRARSVLFGDRSIDFGLHALLLGRRSSLFRLGRSVTSGLEVKPLGASIFRNGRLEQILGASPLSVLSAEGLALRSLLAFLTRIVRSKKRKELYRISLDELCSRYRATDNVRDFLRCLSIGLVVNKDFSRVSAGEILAYLQLSTKRFGMAGYPAGGWKSIWDRFEKVLTTDEGRLRLDESLKEVRIENGRITLCRTDRETYQPRLVVLAVPPKAILEQGLLPAESVDPETWRKLNGCKMTYGLNIDLVIEGSPVPRDMIFTLDPPTLAMLPTAASPGLAGSGRHLLTIFEPLGAEPDPEMDANAETDALVDLYERVVPNLKNRIHDRMVTVLPVVGAEVTVDSNFLDRPEIKGASPENLFMIGDWVKCPGVGGERAFASALKCYDQMTK